MGFAFAFMRRRLSVRSAASLLALVGPEYAMGKAFLALQGAKDFTLQVHVHDQPRFLFNMPLTGVVRLDRDRDVWILPQRSHSGIDARLPARVIASALLAPCHQLGIESQRNVVDEEPLIDARGVDLPHASRQSNLQRVTPT